MKTRKNNIYFKKSNFIFFKICLWVSFCFIFINFSFLRPSGPNDFIRELIVFLLLATTINIHTAYLYPKFSKKNWMHILLLTGVIIICSLLEMLIIPDNFDASYSTFLDKKKYSITIFCNILLRNSALFVFFTWVEYFHRLILLLYKKDCVQQKEIAFLIEKQKFEKNYSRKKLLFHYFFNILELIRVKSFNNDNNSELLDKITFILYYFLVDAEYEMVELDKEIVFYQYYIELENYRHSEKVDVSFNVLGKIEGFYIIPLLFEPLIGNAMKYTKRDGTGYVCISIDTTQFPVLNFYCKNNYSNTSSNVASSASGLKILEQRLELCYKNKYALNINQSVDFYEVTLSIEIE